MTDLALAVDIGGTKMASGLVSMDGSLLERSAVPTEVDRPSRGVTSSCGVTWPRWWSGWRGVPGPVTAWSCVAQAAADR